MNSCIAPSVLAADLARLSEQVEQVVLGGADWIHVDVMDGHFTPTITFGSPLIRALRRITDLPLDVHLMVEHPERYIEEFAAEGTGIFTLHPEATIHLQRHLALIRNRGMLAGVALNPGTPLGLLPASTGKIQRVRALLDSRGSRARLEVDGGITRTTIRTAWEAGADTFVAGTAVFGARDPAQAVRELKTECTSEA
jgi:ribulose-phosphate 3-epimerase